MKNHKIGGRIAAVAVFALAATTMVGVSTATAAALTDTTWSVSNSETGATAVTYTYEFTTATAGTIKSVTATVPAGVTGTPVIEQVYGIGTGGIALASNLLTYTPTAAAPVSADVPIYIKVSGFTNPTTAGAYKSTVTTFDNATTSVEIDSVETAQAVTFGAASTGVTVEVPQSLTFENDTASFELQLDPAVDALSTVSKAVVLKVQTNAGQGYKLTAANTGLETGANSPITTAYTIPNASTSAGTTATAQADDSFAFTTAGTTLSGNSTIGTLFSAANNYVGYGTTAAATSLLTASGPTGDTADVLTITNQVKISFDTPAGTYTDTITYVATPTY